MEWGRKNWRRHEKRERPMVLVQTHLTGPNSGHGDKKLKI